MDYRYIAFLLFPIIWFLGAKWFLRSTINWFETATAILIVVTSSSLFYFTGKYSQTVDTEILNGKVLSKTQRTETCPSGWNDWPDSFCTEYSTRQKRVYPDRCTTDSQGHRTCHPRYKTQYKYHYPWERKWYVTDSFTTHTISRVDKQGANEPPRWTKAYVGEPASSSHTFTNYVKAAPDSLFNNTVGYKAKIVAPVYPIVFDYYRTKHALALQFKDVNKQNLLEAYNLEIGNILRDAGAIYQVNATVILTNNPDSTIRHDIERAWVGGKKNDVVIFLGYDPTNTKLVWADVMTWAKNYNNELFQVELRNKLISLSPEQTNPVDISKIVMEQIKSNYNRPKMEDFKYLESRIEPPVWILWIVGFICFLCPIGLTIFFHKNDVDPFTK